MTSSRVLAWRAFAIVPLILPVMGGCNLFKGSANAVPEVQRATAIRGQYLDHFDEPIIIENAPVRMYFNPFRKLGLAGGLLPDGKGFVRLPSEGIAAVRFWYGDRHINCPSGTGATCEGTAWVPPSPLKVHFVGDKTVTFTNPGNSDVLLMNSELDLKRRTGADPTRIQLADETIVIDFVDFGTFKVYPRNPSTPNQQGDPNDATPIRIQLCAKADADHCPNKEDWP